MTLLFSIAAGALLGATLSMVFLRGRTPIFYTLVGALGTGITGVLLAGFMVNPAFLSPTVSPAAIGRSLSGGLLLLTFFLLLHSRSRGRQM